MGNFKLLKKKDEEQINSLYEIKTDTSSLVKVVGHAYISCFIYDGDVLVIDTDIPLYEGAKVFVKIGDKECIKIYRKICNFGYLQTDISTIFPISMGELKYEVIGVITRVIHISNPSLMN